MKFKNEKIVLRFLFDEMEEQERFEFEQRFAADDDLFEQIKVVEDELIERYIREWMSADESLKFEKCYLSTKPRQERVEFSRTLLGQIDKGAESSSVVEEKIVRTEEASSIEKFRAWFMTPVTVAVSALGVGLVLFFGWMIFQNLGNERNIVVQGNTSAATSPEIVGTPEENASPVPSPESGNSAQPEQSPDDVETTPSPSKSEPEKPKIKIDKTPKPVNTPRVQKAPASPVLALFPGTLRSSGRNNLLNLPKGSKGATLVLRLPDVDYELYQVKISDPDGNPINEFDNLKVANKAVRVFVSSGKLVNGDYLITLSGKTGSGVVESVADYQFRVKQ